MCTDGILSQKTVFPGKMTHFPRQIREGGGTTAARFSSFFLDFVVSNHSFRQQCMSKWQQMKTSMSQTYTMQQMKTAMDQTSTMLLNYNPAN